MLNYRCVTTNGIVNYGRLCSDNNPCQENFTCQVVDLYEDEKSLYGLFSFKKLSTSLIQVYFIFHSENWVYTFRKIKQVSGPPFFSLLFFVLLLVYVIFRAGIISIFYDSFRTLRVDLSTNEIFSYRKVKKNFILVWEF